jgi:hypothetical protein
LNEEYSLTTLQSIPHGKKVIGSFVKNILHQQWHIHEQHTEEWKKQNMKTFFFSDEALLTSGNNVNSRNHKCWG